MSSLEIYPGVVSDSEVLGGEAVIKGTRVPSRSFSAISQEG